MPTETSNRVITTYDFFKTQEKFEIIQTNLPGVLQTYPTPENLEPYYHSDNYQSHKKEASSPIDYIYRLLRKYNLFLKYKLIKDLDYASADILDFGCGTGELVQYLNTKGYNAVGYEPNRNALSILKERGTPQIKNIQQIENQYDIITLFHVLEHLREPIETINLLKKHLTINGLLIIALPNHSSWDAAHYQQFWAAYDVPRHLWHYNKEGIKQLLNQLDFKLIKQSGQPFDPYFISLLSEQYKKSKFPFSKALIKGSISNIKALYNKQYSSNIFVFTRK